MDTAISEDLEAVRDMVNRFPSCDGARRRVPELGTDYQKKLVSLMTVPRSNDKHPHCYLKLFTMNVSRP
jgi:hypothetical protein